MKNRNDLLRVLDLREMRHYYIVRRFRRMCVRCGRLSWEHRMCLDCRREVTRQRLARAT